MKKIKSIFIVLMLFMGLASTNVIDSTIHADTINPSQQDYNNSLSYYKKTLGKKLYRIYDPIDRRLNNNTFHYLITSTNKIDFNYYNKYSRIRKYYGTPTELYESNTTTTNDDINNAAWAQNSNGKFLKRELFNGRDVYYHINATGEMADLYNAAIQAWNSLGVIQLIPTNDNNDKVIQFNGGVDTVPVSSSAEQGQTAVGGTYIYSYDDGTLYNTSIMFANSILNKDYFEQLTVIEHEIGHALGFAHDNEELNNARQLLMNYKDATAGDNYNEDYSKEDLVGALEQHKLMQMYNLSVLPGYYTYAIVNPGSYTG